MPAERNAFKLGLTLIVFAALLTGILIFLAPAGAGDMTLYVWFPHEQLNTVLKPGGEVTCAGKTVGSIRRVELKDAQREDPDSKEAKPDLYAVVTIAVDSTLGLRKDCEIGPEGTLLAGVGKLVILHRGVGEPLQPNDDIDGKTGAGIADLTRMLQAQLDPKDPASLMARILALLDSGSDRSLVGKLLASLDDVNAITTSLRNEFDPQQKELLLAKLHDILGNVHEVTRLLRSEMDAGADAALLAKVHTALDTLNAGLSTVVTLLEDTRRPITDAVGHVRNTTQIMEEQIAARIAAQLDPADAATLMAKVHVAVGRLGEALADINVITDAGKETVVLNKEQISGMVVNLKETSDHLKGASKDIRRNPWRLFYQPRIEEAAQANVFDAARAFAEAATRLDDAIARLQALEAAGGGPALAGDPQLDEIRQQLRITFDQFTKAEAALWDQLKIK